MKKLKLLSVLCLSIVMLSIFNVVSATTNEDIAIIKDNNGEYTIYANGKGDKFIYFAFSDDENVTKDKLEFQVPKKDSDGVNVAFVSNEAYTKYFEGDNKSYMFIGNDKDNLTKVEVDLSEYISQNDIDTLKNITNKIKIETGKKTDITETDKEVITTTIGTVKISDESLTDIKYALLSNNIDNLLSDLSCIKELNTSDKYTMIKEFTKFKTSYNNLLSNTKYTVLEENTIMQPAGAKDGDKYVLLISAKDANGNLIDDVKILSASSNSSAETKEVVTQKEIEKVVKAPVTSENITLIVFALVLVVALMVLVAIKLRKTKKV